MMIGRGFARRGFQCLASGSPKWTENKFLTLAASTCLRYAWPVSVVPQPARLLYAASILSSNKPTKKSPQIPVPVEELNFINNFLADDQTESEMPPASNYTIRTHTCGDLGEAEVGQTVTLAGWLTFKRFGGKFIVLRDAYGVVQAFIPEDKLKLVELASGLSHESVIQITGSVVLRPLNQQRKDTKSGAIEVLVHDLVVLSQATDLRLPSYKDFTKAEEDTRMKYRYLDIRTEILQKRLRFRAKLLKRMRDFMSSNHFIDVDTPTLLRKTPGGAREFPVATHHQGLFYCLAQSPQILKQLLMVGGMDRYYQVARCYRDEKAKPERQPEFTQFDLELSFTTRENVMKLVEDLVKYTLKLDPQISFEVISYQTAMSKYGTDKPYTDGFAWIIDFPLFEQKDDGAIESAHHPFTQPKDEELVYKNPLEATGLSYDLVYRGDEIGGGSIRIHNSALQRHVFENILKLPLTDIEYLLNALESGCPPHGGFAFGIDRFIAQLTGAKSIREVIAFPKSSEGKDLLSGGPSPLTHHDKTYYNLK